VTESIREQYRKARDDQLNRNEARRIRIKVNKARGSTHDAGLRWPFELLQNALDAGPREGREFVSLSLYASEGAVVFEHDGAPFSLQELAALLSGGSSKDFEAEEQTGRFGTGFLVTHVLAETTRLTGLVTGEVGFEKFTLVLDRGGDEAAILVNMEQCEKELEGATRVKEIDSEPSAIFKYLVDDDKSLELGFNAFVGSLPYLYSTRATLGRVRVRLLDGTTRIWTATPSALRECTDGLAFDRQITVTDADGSVIDTYRSLRFQTDDTARSAAVVLLARVEDGWQVCLPPETFPRVFRDYPIRGSSFLPLNFVLDGKFEVSQERDRLLMTDSDQALLADALDACLISLQLAVDEGWQDCHLLAYASRVSSSFGDNEEEVDWWNSSLARLANAFAALPIIETDKGGGAALRSHVGWFVDFPLPRLLTDSSRDETTLERIWPLVNDADNLFPPTRELAEDWCAIAEGWRNLGVDVNRVAVCRLAEYVTKDTMKVEDLQLRVAPLEWLARFVDLVGECWKARDGVDVHVLDGVLPNQIGALCSPEDLTTPSTKY
jgi:hypothetical protein